MEAGAIEYIHIFRVYSGKLVHLVLKTQCTHVKTETTEEEERERETKKRKSVEEGKRESESERVQD